MAMRDRIQNRVLDQIFRFSDSSRHLVIEGINPEASGSTDDYRTSGGREMRRLSRISLKCRQIIAFFRSTKTPLALTADAIRMKRRPFVAISRDNIKLSLAPSRGESFTFYENLIRRDYLSGGIRLKPGDTVVDIGANIGSFTVLAASIVGPGGRVIALEPVSGTFARLQKNVGLNRLENVTCRNEAVDSRAGTLEIRVAAKSALVIGLLRRRWNRDRPRGRRIGPDDHPRTGPRRRAPRPHQFAEGRLRGGANTRSSASFHPMSPAGSIRSPWRSTRSPVGRTTSS